MGRSRAIRWLFALARQPEALAFLPALSLVAYWAGGERALLVTALAVPLLSAVAAVIAAQARGRPGGAVPPERPDAPEDFECRLDAMITRAEAGNQRTACLVLLMDNAEVRARRLGPRRWAEAMGQCHRALAAALRDGDVLHRCSFDGFAVALGPSPRMDIEAALQITTRLQDAVARTVLHSGDAARLTASAGICPGDAAPEPGAAALIEAAGHAARRARRAGPQGLRAFSTPQSPPRPGAAEPSTPVLFQPRLSTDTGAVSGFAICPAATGTLIRSEDWTALLQETLTALSNWDRACVPAPCAILPCPAGLLEDAGLASTLEWELDRFEIEPGRIALAVLAGAVAPSSAGRYAQGLDAVARLGCPLEIPAGGESRGVLQRLARIGTVRLVIEGEQVRRIETDPERRRAVAVTLASAEEASCASVADGVGSAAEHATLAQLGCTDVQGPVIASPMPFAETLSWARANDRRLQRVVRLGDVLR